MNGERVEIKKDKNVNNGLVFKKKTKEGYFFNCKTISGNLTKYLSIAFYLPYYIKCSIGVIIPKSINCFNVCRVSFVIILSLNYIQITL